MRLPNGVRRRMIERRYFGDAYRDRKKRFIYKPWLLLRNDFRFVLAKSGSKTTMKFVYRYGRKLDAWKYGGDIEVNGA